MQAGLEKREGPDGLTFHVKEGLRLRPVLLAFAASAGFFYFTWRIPSSRMEQGLLLCIILLIFASEAFSAWRGVDVELCVTNLDLMSKGHAPGSYQPSSIARADIYELEYREAQGGGGDFPDMPEGLYAQHQRDWPGEGSVCLLPNVGRVQTQKIIQDIVDRFPDTGTLASRPPNPSPLISLNLSGPADRGL